MLVAEGRLWYVAYSSFRRSRGCMSHWHVQLGLRVADLRRMQCCKCLCPARGKVSDRYSAQPTHMDSLPTASCRRPRVTERGPRSRMGAVANQLPTPPPPAPACQLAPTIPFHSQKTCQQRYGIIGAHCRPEQGEAAHDRESRHEPLLLRSIIWLCSPFSLRCRFECMDQARHTGLVAVNHCKCGYHAHRPAAPPCVVKQ